MRFGSQLPTVAESCGPSSYYVKHYRKGTQLADALAFVHAHRRQLAFVTIDLGAGDLTTFDAQFNLVFCVLQPAGCRPQLASLSDNLAAILTRLRAAMPRRVPLIGMNYYDAFAPMCHADPSKAFVCVRVDQANAVLSSVYRKVRVPVADVAAAFQNRDLDRAAVHVCAWTWVCSADNQHPNVQGYGVIARAFAKVVRKQVQR